MIKKKQDAHFTPFVTFPWKSTPFLSTFPQISLIFALLWQVYFLERPLGTRPPYYGSTPHIRLRL